MEIRETAAGKRGAALREANRSFEDRARNHVVESMRGEIKESLGVDIMSDEAKASGLFDIMSPSFSLKGLLEAARRGRSKVREANVAGTVQQFLRAGIQLAINNMYQKTDTTFDPMYQTLPSNKAVELYAAAFRSTFPDLKGFGEEANQAEIAGTDIQVPNQQKAVKMFTVTEEMFLFDQTSQVQQQAQQIAENFPIFADSHAAGRFMSNAVNGAYAVLDANNNAVPVSKTGTQAGETTWPWNVAFTNGGGKNRLTSYTAASYETIIQLRAMARQMLDQKGHKMLVNPDTVFCGVGLTDGFELMLKSSMWPSSATISSVAGGGAVKTDMAIGISHADNLLKGKFNLVDSIWLPNTAYGIAQAGKGFIKQMVRPVRVQVENPMSGPSFTGGLVRNKIDEIWTFEWLEPRFALLGSEGSV